MAPVLLIYTVFIMIPAAIAVYYSFTEYSGLGKAVFNGLDNYIRLFQDKLFLVALKNTFLVLGCSIAFLMAGSFFAALIMNTDFKGNGLFKMVLFAPYIIAPIIIGIIWGYILNPNYGLLNSLIRAAGLEELAIEWIGGRRWTPLSLAIVFTWQVLGFHSTIFLSGLRTIPQELYEAAAIDGAGSIRRVKEITLPMLKETIIINTVLVITGVFKIYELVVQLTGGGPAHQSELLTSYMYFTVFQSRKYGYGMAIAVVVLLCSAVGSVAYIRITSRKRQKGVL